jgi:hypothetical protein
MKTRLTLVIDVENATLRDLQDAMLTAEDIADGCSPELVTVHDIIGALYSSTVSGFTYDVHDEQSEEI